MNSLLVIAILMVSFLWDAETEGKQGITSTEAEDLTNILIVGANHFYSL